VSTGPSAGRAVNALAVVDGLLTRDGEPQAARRASVCLLRLAVESAVDDVWHEVGRPEVCRVSRRAQFLVLPRFRDPATASSAAALWGALACAGHHHAYELTPTAGELASWRAETAACLDALAAPDRGSQTAEAVGHVRPGT